MDSITRKLDDKIIEYEFAEKTTDIACFNKIKLDYFLMLTIAVAWDLKKKKMNERTINNITKCLHRPVTGRLIRIIESELALDKRIVKIFDTYKDERNYRFGHTTFDEHEASKLNAECKKCWESLMKLSPIEDKESDLVRKLYQEENDFYYIASVKHNGDMLVKQFGNKNGSLKFSNLIIKANMANKENDVKEGDLYIFIDGQYIKVSPFIQYNEKEELFLMLMDVETSPSLAFKMAYVYRTQYANESGMYLDNFPNELIQYYSAENTEKNSNGLFLNHFSQYDLFEQEYFKDVHLDVQDKLDSFISGNMSYGAVRGVGGVGKTSVVFMWINRMINNEKGILDKIRQKFKIRRIIFLSAKTRIYSREINEDSLSNFYEIKSDVGDYYDIVEAVYSILQPQEKDITDFGIKENYIKNYSVQSRAVLIIIDDYESLSQKSRDKVQILKDSLNPNAIKMLITTRFASKESKDIIVEKLSIEDCARMTDYIFESREWEKDLSKMEMHNLTGGLPLLIWYAKAFFVSRQLTSQQLKSRFKGPAEGLEGYLFDNFVQCFDDTFVKNFLMVVTRYYELHNSLQISKEIAILLCLAEPKEYKIEDEEFYFRELVDLKLISINKSSNVINYSPLMTYMDKTTKRQEPKEEYQEDSLKVVINLDEENEKDLYAVIKAADSLENETACRILERVINFCQDDEAVKSLALSKIFSLADNKLLLYEENEHAFQNNMVLIDVLLDYLLKNKSALKVRYEIVRDFVKGISVFLKKQDNVEHVSSMAVELITELLSQSFEEFDYEKIKKSELEGRIPLLCGLVADLLSKITRQDEKEKYRKDVNNLLDDNSTLCGDYILEYKV